MSDSAAAVAPVVNTPATSAETGDSSQENAELDAAEAAEEGEVVAEPAKTTKLDPKKAKENEKRLKKLKLKVDGKEIEEEIDLDDEDRLIRELQMSKMGQKRAQQHADLEKQVRAFFTDFGKDPFHAMSQLGMKPEEVIDQYINKQMENAKKTPEQLRAEQLEQELQRIKFERDNEKKESEKREFDRLQEQAFKQYDVQMEQSLAKSDLPKTPYTVKKIADYMLAALQAGKDVSPDDVIPLVREEMHNDLKEMFASLPEDAVEQLIGEQMLNKLRKKRVAKAQAAQQAIGKAPIKDTGISGKSQEKKSGEKKSFKDFFGI
jgi:hypothetical protein